MVVLNSSTISYIFTKRESQFPRSFSRFNNEHFNSAACWWDWLSWELLMIYKHLFIESNIDSIPASLFVLNWLSWQIVSDDKIQITILILRRGALSNVTNKWVCWWILLLVFAKGCLLTGQEQTCNRITWLFVCLFVAMLKVVVDCPLVITSKVKLLCRPNKTRKEEWTVQPVFCMCVWSSTLMPTSRNGPTAITNSIINW